MSRLLAKVFVELSLNFVSGVALPLEEPRMLRIDAIYSLVDGDAMRIIWSLKGASGLNPCPLHCRNVFSKRSGMEGAGAVTICCADVGMH